MIHQCSMLEVKTTPKHIAANPQIPTKSLPTRSIERIQSKPLPTTYRERTKRLNRQIARKHQKHEATTKLHPPPDTTMLPYQRHYQPIPTQYQSNTKHHRQQNQHKKPNSTFYKV
jgi:hypothetical protein